MLDKLRLYISENLEFNRYSNSSSPFASFRKLECTQVEEENDCASYDAEELFFGSLII